MKTKTRFHKLTAWLLTLAMLMTFIPTFSQMGTGLTVYAAEGTGSDSDDSESGGGTGSGGGETGSGGSSETEGDGTEVSYLAPVYEDGKIRFDENNDVVFETKTVTDYIVTEDITYGSTIISADQMPTIGTSSETTWYVADSDIEWKNFVLVQGDVHLIICDDITITSIYGIVVSEGNSLTIYGQENGTGTLVANGMNYSGGFYSAAIGGCDVTTEMANGGTITINGGIISASASPNAAAIGGSKRGTGGTITINGGSVDAKGAAYSAAIGGGSGGNSGNITINGGSVSAETSGSSSAIGAGYVRYSSTGESILAKTDKIEINGGTVVATHTDSYAEYPVIGGLYGFDNINISGGHITVSHARTGGIGIGTNSVTVMEFGGNLNISGGTIISGNDKTLYLGAGKTSSSAKGTVDVVVTGGNISGAFKNASTLTDGKSAVEMKEITVDGAEDQTEVTVLEDYPTYGLCDVVTDGDKVVIYVPVSKAYAVTISDTIANGTVTADVSEASEGDTVTLTITPDEGYSLKSVSATDAEGNDVPVTDNTFKMPASEVTVSAEFEYANTIYIVGDFNSWYATDPSCVMTKNSDGKYVITKELEGGIRRFKIVKNGIWDSSLGIGEESVLSNGVAAALVGNGFDAQIELASATAVTFLFDPVAMTVTVSWDEAGEEPDDATYRIAGNFNSWNAEDPSYVMTKNSDGKYVFTTELSSGSHQFRIVKNGIWDGSLGTDEQTVLSNGVAAALVGNGFDAQIELASATAVTFLFDPVAMTVTVSWDEAGEEPDDATYSIIGSFNGWDVRDTSYTMALNSDGKYVIAAEIEGGNYEFKIANNYSWEGNLGISDTEDAISNGETVALVENGENNLYFELAETSEVTFVFDPVAMTITVSWEAFVPTLFEVIIADTQNGSVSASPDFTVPGDTVILTVTPDEGYTLKSVSVTDEDGGDVPTTDNTFTMPASNVIVTATFEAKVSDEITVYISTYADFPADEYKATDGENALDYLNTNYFMAQMYDMVGWELLRDGETYYVTEDTVLSDGDTYYMIWWLGNGGSDLGIFGNCTVDMFDGISYNSYAIGSGGISGVKHKVDGVEYTFDLDTEVYTIKSAFESKGIDTDKTYTANGNEVDLDTNMPLAYTEFEAEKAGHSHPVCGALHTDIGDHKGECEAIEWTAWNGDSMIFDSGYYYLTGDVNASVLVSGGSDVHICLNGYTLDGSGESTVFVANGSFTLTDCVGTGKLTGGTGTNLYGSDARGGGICSESSGIVTVYGGSITGNSADYMGAGICSSGKLYLYGGSVAGNSFNDEEAQTIDKSQVYASNLILYGGSFDSVRGDYITLGGSPEISGFLRTNGSFLRISGELTNTTPIPLLCEESLYGDDTVQIGSGCGGYVDKFEAYEQYAEIKNEDGELVYLCPIRVAFRSNDGSGILYEETLPATGGKLTSIPELPAKKGYAPFWYSYMDGAPTPSTETVYTKSAEYIVAYEPYTIELEELPNGYRISSPNGTVKGDGIAWHKATETTVAVNLDNAEPYAYDGNSSSYENGKWVPLESIYFIADLKAGNVLIVTPDDMSNFAKPSLMNNTSWGIAECIIHDTFVEFKIKVDGQYSLYSYDSDYEYSTTPVSAELNTYEIGEAIEGETLNIFNNGTNGEYYNVRVEFTDGTVLEEVFEYDIPIPALLTLVINLEREYGGNFITDAESGYTSRGKLIIKDSDGKIAIEAFENEMGWGQSLDGKTVLIAYIDGIPVGDYTIIFEKPGYCMLDQSITVVEGNNELIVTPVCGDIRGSLDDKVGDGKVDFDDFIRVLRGFNNASSTLLRASVDLNEDGVVNVNDLAIIKAAMNK